VNGTVNSNTAIPTWSDLHWRGKACTAPPAKPLDAWAFGPGERQRVVSENGNLTRNLVPLQRVRSALFVAPFVYMCHDLGGGPAASFRLDGLRMAASLTRAMGLRCRI
jgi:hypothetical protein